MPYRAEMARNPAAFVEQLPFYRARVVFCRLVYALHKLGINVVLATVLASEFAYAATCGLLFHWMSRYLAPVGAAVVSLLVVASPPFLRLRARVCPMYLAGSWSALPLTS